MRRFIAVFLCALMLTGVAYAGEDDQQAFLDLLARAAPTSNEYRIGLPERAPDAHDAAEVSLSDTTTVFIDADIYDFGVARAVSYRATPPEMDAEKLIAFFWPDADAAAVLAAVESADGVETYAHAGGQLQLSRANGAVSFLADMKRADTVAVRYHSSLTSDLSGLPEAPGAVVDLDTVNGRARDFAALFGIAEAPMLLEASAHREQYPDGALDVEIYACALMRDGLPFSTRPYPADPEVTRIIPAQQLTMAFDEHGLADLRATVFHLEPLGDAQDILPFRAALDDLNEGEGFLWLWGDSSIASITLEYILTPLEDAYACAPAWSFHEVKKEGWGANVFSYSALTGEYINS